MTALQIRKFFHDLFSSGLVDRLEEDLMRLRNDCELRVRDKEEVIADLRQQLAQARTKLDTYELVLLPITSPAGSLFKPKTPPPTFEPLSEPSSWQSVQDAYYAQQEKDAEAERAQETKNVPV